MHATLLTLVHIIVHIIMFVVIMLVIVVVTIFRFELNIQHSVFVVLHIVLRVGVHRVWFIEIVHAIVGYLLESVVGLPG